MSTFGSSRILVVDNYDSFVHTIVGYLQQLGATTTVLRNDEVTAQMVCAADYDGVLISPGPGAPSDAGNSPEIIAACAAQKMPLLGVCLGHQGLAEFCGATVCHAPELMHGKTSVINHDGNGIFTGLPSPLTVTRYHSLVVAPETVPAELEVNATTPSGLVMAIRHRTLPLWGVQFHPEAVLTVGGYRMLANWLELCGDGQSVQKSEGLSPIYKRAQG